jgi:CheY-like chemotaxis protein
MAGHHLRVLVVDDQVEEADVLLSLLRSWGHEPRVAPAGPEELTADPDFRPEVVLLDIDPPVRGVLAVARRLRADPATARAVLVGVTGPANDGIPVLSRMAGIDNLIVKPVSPGALRVLLGLLVPAGEGAAPAASPRRFPRGHRLGRALRRGARRPRPGPAVRRRLPPP